MTLRNILSEKQTNKLNYFINATEDYLKHYNEVNPSLNSNSETYFDYPIEEYNKFIKELDSDKILKNIETVTVSLSNSDELNEIIFEPENEDIFDIVYAKRIFPLISKRIFDSHNYRRELLNFMEIESDSEIAKSKAKFFEEIYKEDNTEYPEVA